jgi:hypothetical protein
MKTIVSLSAPETSAPETNLPVLPLYRLCGRFPQQKIEQPTPETPPDGALHFMI